jgi:hypothetical protein
MKKALRTEPSITNYFYGRKVDFAHYMSGKRRKILKKKFFKKSFEKNFGK